MSDELLGRLGAEISPELLKLALTHSSFAYENGGSDNERLEFLGDSVLGYLVASHIFTAHQELSEGELTKLKNGVVSAQALAVAANRIDLGKYLFLGKGEEQTEGRRKENILADPAGFSKSTSLALLKCWRSALDSPKQIKRTSNGPNNGLNR